MITTFYPPYSFGGDAIYIYRLSNELARRGHRVDVICDCNSFYLLSRSVAKGNFPNHPNVTLYALSSAAGFLSPLATHQTGVAFFKRRKIAELIQSNQYDVIHYHNMSLIGLSIIHYGTGIKLYTMHEHWLVCPMHVLWKYDREVCTKKNCISCQILGMRPPQLWRYAESGNQALSQIDAFISPSRFTRSKHHEMGFDFPIVHLPYFLPKTTESSASGSSNIPFESYFLFVGRLEKIKGLQTILPVFRKYPQFRLLIAGEGSYQKELMHLAGESPNIIFLGKLDHSRLQELYQNAVAVVVPSICYEVFGIIMIEAFAMKTPVIVRNLGALPEIAEESEAGLVYNDEVELVDALTKVSEDHALRDRLGSNGYKAYLSHWDEESHLKQYMGLIQQLELKRSPLRQSVV